MKYPVIFLFTLFVSPIFSQTQGEITYQIETFKDNLKKPNPENSKAKNMALEMLHNAKPVEAYLIFKDNIGLYYVEPKNDIPIWDNSDGNLNISSAKINIAWFMAGADNLYYTDIDRNYNINSTDVTGERMRIISDSLIWKKSNETKKIKGYNCLLATLKVNEKKTLKVWYTTDIPVKLGPRGYNGLPGLILEIEGYRYNWKAIKIDLQKKIKEIDEPKEGKLITEKEFKEQYKFPTKNN